MQPHSVLQRQHCRPWNPQPFFAQTDVSVPQDHPSRRVALEDRSQSCQLLSCGRSPTLLDHFRGGAVPLILTAHRLSK